MTETDTKRSDDVDESEDTTTDEAPPENDKPDNDKPETDEAQAENDEPDDEDEPDDDEPVSEHVDQGPALREGGTLNIGLCHFGGEGEPASILATREDGTGWIGVCEKHTKDAEEQGFVLEDESKRQSQDQSESETQEPTDEEREHAERGVKVDVDDDTKDESED